MIKIISSALALFITVSVLSAAPKKDIVDTAVGAGSFKTLVAAVKAAGLVDTLKGEGPFTVFAPTDEAFAKLPKGTVESLLKPENKQKLVSILTYHVVPGQNLAAEVPLARQVVAGFALVGGVVATPVAFYFLIKRGTQEAAGVIDIASA